MKTTKRHLVVLAAGGTGGHIFPAEALAGELLSRGHDVALLTDARGEIFGRLAGRVTVYPIRAGRVSGGGLMARLSGMGELVSGFFEARKLLQKLSPAVVVGFGGYASVPTMVAAQRLGIATLLHEQNAVLGRANRLLAGRVDAIATSFPEVVRLREADRAKAKLTGNPVREAITAVGQKPYPAFGEGDVLRILVIGGSQGASVFSKILPRMAEALPESLRTRLTLTQQCRKEDLDGVRAAYDRLGVKAELAPFFPDIPARLEKAHLVICRAGASSVAEVASAKRPAIMVPYPSALDDHQTANARAVESRGGGWVVPQPHFTPEHLLNLIKCFLAKPEQLARAAQSAAQAGFPDAAQRLADMVCALMPAANGQHAHSTKREKAA